MKKSLILLLILCVTLASTGCGLLKNNKKTTGPKPGDKVEGEEVTLYDENMQFYTAETLPDDYNRKDFDGDGMNNVDEIENGTDMYKVDTDGDGIGDLDEIEDTKTDPLKWSSRDDDISDLEYHLKNAESFEEGYTSTDANGFKVYLAKAEDRLYIVSKTSTKAFDDLETISEAFQIKNFTGKMALNCNKYLQEVADGIAIYKDVDGKAVKLETVVNEDRLIEFNIEANDVIVVVYNGE